MATISSAPESAAPTIEGQHPDLERTTSGVALARNLAAIEIKATVHQYAETFHQVYELLEKSGFDTRSPDGIFNDPKAAQIIASFGLSSEARRALQIFDAFYKEAAKLFPADAVESPKKIMEYMAYPGDGLRLMAFVDRRVLEDPSIPVKVFGGIHYQNLTTEHGVNFIMAENIWVPLDARKDGYGPAIIKAGMRMANELGAEFIMGEMNDPHIMSRRERETDLRMTGRSPEVRARLWGLSGFSKLDAPYIQPPLDEESNAVHCLAAISHIKPDSQHLKIDGVGRNYIDKELYLSALRVAHDYEVEGPESVRQARHYKQIERQLADIERIYLLPPRESRSLAQPRVHNIVY